MNITIYSIGKFDPLSKELFLKYSKRLDWKIEIKELEIKSKNNLSTTKIKDLEGELILKSIKNNQVIIALDENGKNISSQEFSQLLSNYAINGNSNIAFIIGGANGLSQEILQKANFKLSFGKMTFPHMMVRIMLIEQIYRAKTIMDGHPYHK